MSVEVRFAIIKDPNSIFGAIGRCGSGYNTRWADWSEKGRENQKKINEEWYRRYDAITGHYSKLERSILKEGFRNPLVITCGAPILQKQEHIPPEFRGKEDLLIMEGYDGGSRLWVAQKHNIPVPVIVNDRSGKFEQNPEISNKAQLKKYFKDPPSYITFSSRGVVVTKLKHTHLDNEYADRDKQARRIIPLWVELLEKYGYEAHVRPQHEVYLTGEQRKRRSIDKKEKKALPFLTKKRVAPPVPKKPSMPPIRMESQGKKPEPSRKPRTREEVQREREQRELKFLSRDLNKEPEYIPPSPKPTPPPPKPKPAPPPVEPPAPVAPPKPAPEPEPPPVPKSNLPVIGNINEVFGLESMQMIETRRFLQIGNDMGDLFVHLFNNEEDYTRTHFFLINGTPFTQFANEEAKAIFFNDIQTMRRICVQRGMQILSVLDATREGWDDRIGRNRFGIVVIRGGLSIKQINYYLRTLKRYLLNSTRIVIEIEWGDTLKLDRRQFEMLEHFQNVIVLEPVFGEDPGNNPIRPKKGKNGKKKKVVEIDVETDSAIPEIPVAKAPEEPKQEGTPKKRRRRRRRRKKKPPTGGDNSDGERHKVIPEVAPKPAQLPKKPHLLDEVVASDWDETAYIVGGGSSLRQFDWNKLGKDKFVIAINQAHKVLPDAQIVYFTDLHYYRPNKATLLEHKGILVRGALNPRGEEKHERITIMHLTGPNGFEVREGKLKHGSNSTYAVVNMLAAHLKFKKIYLLGIDMKWGNRADKKTTHWHEGYKRATPESTYARMRNNFKTLLGPLKKNGVEVINVINPKCPSALEHFPKKTLEEVFGE